MIFPLRNPRDLTALERDGLIKREAGNGFAPDVGQLHPHLPLGTGRIDRQTIVMKQYAFGADERIPRAGL